jgi:hypothetical protein
MKNYYLSLTMSALSFCAFSQSISWNSPVTVANGGTYSNVYPRITLTENDIPVVSWENSNSGNIYAAR